MKYEPKIKKKMMCPLDMDLLSLAANGNLKWSLTHEPVTEAAYRNTAKGWILFNLRKKSVLPILYVVATTDEANWTIGSLQVKYATNQF